MGSERSLWTRGLTYHYYADDTLLSMARQPLAHQLVDVAELNTTGEKIADDQKTKRARLRKRSTSTSKSLSLKFALLS